MPNTPVFVEVAVVDEVAVSVGAEVSEDVEDDEEVRVADNDLVDVSVGADVSDEVDEDDEVSVDDAVPVEVKVSAAQTSLTVARISNKTTRGSMSIV